MSLESETQNAGQRIDRREFKYRETFVIPAPNLSNVVFLCGGCHTSTTVSRKQLDKDISTNSPFASKANNPLDANAIFPQEGDVWDILESLIGSIEGPSDWASQHDHYLYGTPRRK